MRKVIFLFVVFTAISTLVGCTNENINNQLDSSQSLIERVKTIETLEHQFNNFIIPYDEYLKGIVGFFVDTDSEIHSYTRIYITHDSESLNELKNLSKEELQGIRNKRDELGYQHEVEVEISDVYTDGYKSKKYIFTRERHINKKDNIISCFTKRYMFINQNGEWLIANVDIGHYDDSYSFEDKVIDGNIPYTRFNNEKVEYIYKFNPY